MQASRHGCVGAAAPSIASASAPGTISVDITAVPHMRPPIPVGSESGVAIGAGVALGAGVADHTAALAAEETRTAAPSGEVSEPRHQGCRSGQAVRAVWADIHHRAQIILAACVHARSTQGLALKHARACAQRTRMLGFFRCRWRGRALSCAHGRTAGSAEHKQGALGALTRTLKFRVVLLSI